MSKALDLLKVDDIETKVDTFIELYMQDRKRLLALPLPDTAHSNNPDLPSLPPKGGASAVITCSSSGSLKVCCYLIFILLNYYIATIKLVSII